MKQIDLDTTRQPALYAEACRHMAECIPGWTDSCPGDPAVAILEYLTYLSDIQNRHLNRVLPSHFQAYLHLLGEAPRMTKPAGLLAARSEICRRGQRFLMDKLPFEITDCPPAALPQVQTVEFSNENGCTSLRSGTAMRLPGGEDGCFRIVLTDSVPAGRPLHFWFLIRMEQGRNLPTDQTAAPVQLSASAGGQEVPCVDHTCGMLRSGMVEITPWSAVSECFLKVSGRWEGRPEICSVILEPVRLLQQQTRSTSVELTAPFRIPAAWENNWMKTFFTPAGTGWKLEPDFSVKDGCVTGWEGQLPGKIRVVARETDFTGMFPLRGIAMECIPLKKAGLCSEQLRVMVEQDGIWYDWPLCEPREGETLSRGCRWESENQTLYFGNGRDYLPPDEGQVLISGCVLSRGAEVNGAFGPLTCDGGSLQPLTEAQGGVTEETAEQAFERCAREQQALRRAVTCEDYEQQARQTPGLAVSRVRAVPRAVLGEKGAGIVILANPKSDKGRPELTAWQKEQMRQYLEPVRMLGVPVEIRSARYCALRVEVSISGSESISPELLRQTALTYTDSLEGPLDFGAEISYTALYSALGRVPDVRLVRYLKLIPLSGGVRRGQDGSIRLSPDQLPYLAEFEIID